MAARVTFRARPSHEVLPFPPSPPVSVQLVSQAASMLVDLPRTTDPAGGPPLGDCWRLSGQNPSTCSGHLTQLAIPRCGGGGRSLHQGACAVLAMFTPSSSVGGTCFGPGCGGWIRHGGGGPKSTTDCVGSITPANVQAVACLSSPTRGRLAEWVAAGAGISTAVSYAPYTRGSTCHVSRRDEGRGCPT